MTTKLEWVSQLRDYDHTFLSPEGVKMFAEAFEVKLTPYKAYADPSDPKGITFHDGAEFGYGMCAADLAEQVCRQLKIKFQQRMGRGFRLRGCCDALEAHFKKNIVDRIIDEA